MTAVYDKAGISAPIQLIDKELQSDPAAISLCVPLGVVRGQRHRQPDALLHQQDRRWHRPHHGAEGPGARHLVPGGGGSRDERRRRNTQSARVRPHQ